MLADIDASAVEATQAGLAGRYGADQVRAVTVDVTDEAAVEASIEAAARNIGGLDILVSNAGIASSAPIEDTDLALWNRNIAILATGYFLVTRAGLPADEAAGARRRDRVHRLEERPRRLAERLGLLHRQGGGDPPCALRRARRRAAGIRVNTVNPDAVLRGSKIWAGEWLEQRASTYKTDKEGLEEMYRKRSLLQRSVYPEDIAEAVYFLVSDASAKSTGNILNVDAGNAQSFTR